MIVEDAETWLCLWCTAEPAHPDHFPYCSTECAVHAECDDREHLPAPQHRVSIAAQLGAAMQELANERRGCYHRDGNPKIRHATEALAITHAKALVARGVHRNAKNLRAYHCDYCDQWHVGHFGGV